MVLSVWAALQRLDPQIENAAVVARRGAVHRAAPHRAAAGHARHPVGRDHRVRARGQRLRHAGDHRRPPAQGRGDARLRRVPEHAELAARRGRRGAAAGRAGADRRRHQPPDRAPLRARCSDEPQRPARARSSTRSSSSSCWRRSWSSAAVAFTPEGYLSLPTDGLSLRWFTAIARYPEFVRAFWRQPLAGRAVLGDRASPFAVPAALAIARYRFRGREAMTALFMSPLMIPHVVLGIAFLRFFTQIGLGGTFARPGARAHRHRVALRAAPDAGRGHRHGPRDRACGGLARRLGLDGVPARDAAADPARASSAAGRWPSSSPSTR